MWVVETVFKLTADKQITGEGVPGYLNRYSNSATCWMVRVQIQGGERDFSLFPTQIGSGVNSASYSMGTGFLTC